MTSKSSAALRVHLELVVDVGESLETGHRVPQETDHVRVLLFRTLHLRMLAAIARLFLTR